MKWTNGIIRAMIWSLFLCTFILSAQSQKEDYWISYIDSLSGNELYGYKNRAGEIKIVAKYIIIGTDTLHTAAFVLSNNKWVMIDKQEKVLLEPFIYDNGPDYTVEGLFRYVENNKIGFANEKGEKVIPAQFDFAFYFSEGLAAFSVGGEKVMDSGGEHWFWGGGTWGYVNAKGKIVIPPKYDYAHEFRDGTAEVQLNGEGVQIDKKGNVLKSQ
ncbi:WG repeat-containing protein [Flavobacterium sp. '19STA2R22 D10 B1']|uniref:WG repeat-containing protein n=1 Tax=Flavobacterium aerium TaxID=3037261 RepID=UPI00278C3570|nr:WG repeat-containing protein [Flavobacterium sp. '19STA2R22 D10 B1']